MSIYDESLFVFGGLASATDHGDACMLRLHSVKFARLKRVQFYLDRVTAMENRIVL